MQSRREFIKLGSPGVAGLVAAPSLTPAPAVVADIAARGSIASVCLVSFKPERTMLIGSCHWSTFDPAKAGTRVMGPASQHLPQIEKAAAS